MASDREQWQAVFEELYQDLNPEKVPEVKRFLEVYEGREYKLFGMVCRKYGLTFHDLVRRGLYIPQEIMDLAAGFGCTDEVCAAGDADHGVVRADGGPKHTSSSMTDAALARTAATTASDTTMAPTVAPCSSDESPGSAPLPLTTSPSGSVSPLPWPADGWPMTFANPKGPTSPVTMLDLNRVVSFLEAEHGLIHEGISPKCSGTVQVDFKKGNLQLLVNNPTGRRSINAWLCG